MTCTLTAPSHPSCGDKPIVAAGPIPLPGGNRRGLPTGDRPEPAGAPRSATTTRGTGRRWQAAVSPGQQHLRARCRHHGQDAVLERHYVPRRSQRTRAVLTFFAQDHASAEMVYANAGITKAEQAAEVIAFADYWKQATGAEPGLLVSGSQLTTYKILGQLTARAINWLTLRQRGKAELERLAALPASAWKTVTISRSGQYRRPQLHEDMIRLTGVTAKVRQIAVKNIGRDEPTLLITHDLTTPARDLFARYAERMRVENELDACIGGFHLDVLTSGVPLNVDLDTTLTVIAGKGWRSTPRSTPRPLSATPGGASD